MYFNSSQGNIYYQEYGANNSPAIVFLHGVGMDHRTFIEQAKALESRYRIIILDLPGHGKSSGIDKNLAFSTTSANMIIELLDYLDIDRIVMIGQSLGSFVVQKAAARYPERILASIHLSGGSLYPGYPAIIRAFKPLVSLIMLLFPQKILYKKFARHKALKAKTQEYLEEITAANGKKIITDLTLEMINDMTEGISKPLSHDLLIVYGEHDLNFIKNLSIKWHKSNANSELVKIKDAHHIANQDNPEKFNEVMETFLGKIA